MSAFDKERRPTPGLEDFIAEGIQNPSDYYFTIAYGTVGSRHK